MIYQNGIKVLTPEDLMVGNNQVSDLSMLDNVDDDINFNIEDYNATGYAIERDLPQNDFNIRTLTQEQINKMKRPDMWSYNI